MLIVDRDSFIAWTEGTLLERRIDGTFVVGDDETNERAEKALEAGETIGLTIGGRLESTMAFDEAQGDYVEKEVRRDVG